MKRGKRESEGTVLVRMRERGVVALPPDMRDHLLFAAVRRPDGVIELRPQRTVDAAQAWFWSERWQRMEHDAQADIDAGQIRRFDDADAMSRISTPEVRNNRFGTRRLRTFERARTHPLFAAALRSLTHSTQPSEGPADAAFQSGRIDFELKM